MESPPPSLFDIGGLALDHLRACRTASKVSFDDFRVIQADNRRLRAIKEDHYQRMEAHRAPLSKRVNEVQETNRELERQIASLSADLGAIDTEIAALEDSQHRLIHEYETKVTENSVLSKKIEAAESGIVNARRVFSEQQSKFDAQIAKYNREYEVLEEVSNEQERKERQAQTARIHFSDGIRHLQELVEPKNLESLAASGKLLESIPGRVAEFFGYRLLDGEVALNGNKALEILEVSTASYDPATNIVTAVCNGSRLFGVDCTSLKPRIIFEIDAKERVTSVQFSPKTGTVIAASGVKKQLKIYSRFDKFASASHVPTSQVVTDVRLLGDRKFVTADDSKSIAIWDLEKLSIEKTVTYTSGKFFEAQEKVTLVKVDEELIFCVTNKNNVLLVDPLLGKCQKVLSDPAKSRIVGVGVAQGYRLAVGFENREIWQFNKTDWSVASEATIKLRNWESAVGKFHFTCGNHTTFVGTDLGNLFYFQTAPEAELVGRLPAVSPLPFYLGYNPQLNSLTVLGQNGDIRTYAAIGWGHLPSTEN